MNLPDGLLIDDYETVKNTITNFIRDYITKSGASGIVIGLSGGIDSSLVASLACDAIGPENVFGIMLPVNAENDSVNINDAKTIADHLDMKYRIFELKNIINEYDSFNLDKLALGNVAARLRMVTLYAIANQENRIVIGTGNKTETLIGYFTKYGDGGVDISPISNLYKANVWGLARHVGIPEHLITKEPSAGLWDGQTDENDIGMSYEEIDSILFLHTEKRMSLNEIVSYGIDKSKVNTILDMIIQSLHKRSHIPSPKI